jgi:flavodoxin
MSKILVTYFSASGTTKKAAERIAEIVGADTYEITPKEPYKTADLNWINKKSRSSIEMSDRSSRPEIVKPTIKLDKYDIILIGFPVWWYTAPTIVNTFIESMDFTGKTLVPFCTSGGSDIKKCEEDLKEAYPEYNWKDGRRLSGKVDEIFLDSWLNG